MRMLVPLTPFVLLSYLGLAGCQESRPAAEAAATGGATAPYVAEFLALDYAFTGPPEIPSGWITFRMPNPSKEHHVLILIRLPEGVSYADWLEAAEHQRETGEPAAWAGEQVVMGGPGALAPGLVGETTVYLAPGQYVMTCGVPTTDGISHSALGMHRALTVTGEESGASEPEADVTLTLRSHEFELEGVISPGRHTIRVHFEDQPDLQHDVHLARLEAGQAVEELAALMQDVSGISNWRFHGGAEQMPAGQTAYFTADFEPGRYAWVCHYHADKGMVEELTVERTAQAHP